MTLFVRSLVLLALSFSPAFAQDESPTAVIESAVTLFAEKMDGRHDELASDPDALYALIDEILLPRFDRKFAAQMVMAKHWRVADEEQRARFIEAFYQALLRRYADGLLEFDQERVSVLPFRGDDSKPRAKVKTTVQTTAPRLRLITNWSSAKRAGCCSMLLLKVSPIFATTEQNSIQKFAVQVSMPSSSDSKARLGSRQWTASHLKTSETAISHWLAR